MVYKLAGTRKKGYGRPKGVLNAISFDEKFVYTDWDVGKE